MVKIPNTNHPIQVWAKFKLPSIGTPFQNLEYGGGKSPLLSILTDSYFPSIKRKVDISKWRKRCKEITHFLGTDRLETGEGKIFKLSKLFASMGGLFSDKKRKGNRVKGSLSIPAFLVNPFF
jgi:hypothetical protein